MPILPSTRLHFIARDHIRDDVYALRFRPERPLRHRAGQHGLLIVPGTYKIKPFSLASSPADDEVVIATHIRSKSSYKRALDRLQPGDTVRLLGPAFWFVLQPDVHDVVFLAQGIGITPFRSMLRHIDQSSVPVKTTLIHIDTGPALFGKETSRLATKAWYPTARPAFAAQLQQTLGEHPEAVYYLSGSVGFVRAARAQLIAAGIPARHIKHDWFLGYW
jgi:ferredoxin-NADP reductase